MLENHWFRWAPFPYFVLLTDNFPAFCPSLLFLLPTSSPNKRIRQKLICQKIQDRIASCYRSTPYHKNTFSIFLPTASFFLLNPLMGQDQGYQCLYAFFRPLWTITWAHPVCCCSWMTVTVTTNCEQVVQQQHKSALGPNYSLLERYAPIQVTLYQWVLQQKTYSIIQFRRTL